MNVKSNKLFLSILLLVAFVLMGCAEAVKMYRCTRDEQDSKINTTTRNPASFYCIQDYLFYIPDARSYQNTPLDFMILFGWDFHTFQSFVMDLAGYERWSEWTNQFKPHPNGSRHIHEFNLKNFVIDFNLTPQKIIEAQEISRNLSMADIDKRKLRAIVIDDFIRERPIGSVMLPARELGYAYIPILGIVTIEELDERGSWINALSSQDIHALFSNCVTTLWQHFPGYGIYQSGRAYSPEWLLNNIERAIYGEALPLEELNRVMGLASGFSVLYDIVHYASVEVNRAEVALENPTPHTLSFNTNTLHDVLGASGSSGSSGASGASGASGSSGASNVSGISPITFNPITINTWEAILPFVEANHQGFAGMQVSAQTSNSTHTEHSAQYAQVIERPTRPLPTQPAPPTSSQPPTQPTQPTPPAQSPAPLNPPTKTIAGVTYVLTNWYFDEALTIPITNTFRMPSRDITIYARWEKIEDDVLPVQYFTVTFTCPVNSRALASLSQSPSLPQAQQQGQSQSQQQGQLQSQQQTQQYTNTIRVPAGTSLLAYLEANKANFPRMAFIVSLESSLTNQVFDRWNLDRFGSTPLTHNFIMPEGDITLYASWRFGGDIPIMDMGIGVDDEVELELGDTSVRP